MKEKVKRDLVVTANQRLKLFFRMVSWWTSQGNRSWVGIFLSTLIRAEECLQLNCFSNTLERLRTNSKEGKTVSGESYQVAFWFTAKLNLNCIYRAKMLKVHFNIILRRMLCWSFYSKEKKSLNWIEWWSGGIGSRRLRNWLAHTI